MYNNTFRFPHNIVICMLHTCYQIPRADGITMISGLPECQQDQGNLTSGGMMFQRADAMAERAVLLGSIR